MENDCLKVTYHKEGVCGMTMTPIHYTVGDIPLIGNIPDDNSWDGKYFRLVGHVVDIGGCFALHVDKSFGCVNPKP